MAILVVEDEPDLSDLLTFMLRRAGHDVIHAFDGEAAIQLWRERHPELILLDVGIPKKDGWEVCRAIRSESSTPIMMITGADSEDDMVRGFELGALDYVTKPFSPRLLQARIRTMLSSGRLEGESVRNRDAQLAVGDLKLDASLRSAVCGRHSASLSRLEFRVLQELSWSCGQVIAHADLIERAWGYKGETSSNVVKGHIRTIRMKLERIGSRVKIRIVPSVGYVLEYPAQTQ